jgi:hypothetical protein
MYLQWSSSDSGLFFCLSVSADSVELAFAFCNSIWLPSICMDVTFDVHSFSSGGVISVSSAATTRQRKEPLLGHGQFRVVEEARACRHLP